MYIDRIKIKNNTILVTDTVSLSPLLMLSPLSLKRGPDFGIFCGGHKEEGQFSKGGWSRRKL